MKIELTKQQQQALDTLHEKPLHIFDPRTNVDYVLVRAEDYEFIRLLLEEEKIRRAIHIVALHNAVGRMDETP